MTAVLNDVWSPDWSERLETVSIACGAVEIRIHHVTSPRPVIVRDGGYAIAGPTRPSTETGVTWGLVRTAGGLTWLIAGLRGFDRVEIDAGRGANACGSCSATPVLAGTGPVRGERVLVSLVLLTGTPVEPARALAAVEVTGRLVTVHCADGECFLVQCVESEVITGARGGRQLEGAVRFARVSPDGSGFTLSA